VNARNAGLVDWDLIEDRTRDLQALSTWNSPVDLLQAAAEQYRAPLWESQKYRPEVWIEKSAYCPTANSTMRSASCIRHRPFGIAGDWHD
jgi:hypothetical protein